MNRPETRSRPAAQARQSRSDGGSTDRVLVTGAMGRVADQLLPGLREQFELRLTDRTGDPREWPGTEFFIGNLADRRLLDKAVSDVDTVVHLAGNPDPAAPWHELREPNIESFAALLSASHEAGVRRVVFASSVHAMGVHEGRRHWPVDPAWPAAPCCSYGATKAFDEALARAYEYRTGMSLIGLRLGMCSPESSPAEASAGWLSSTDLRRVVIAAIAAETRFGVYHAVSWPSRHRWSIDATIAELGYQPERQKRDYPVPADAPLSTCAYEGGG